MTEIGPVSYGCPKQPGVLHVIESAYIAEVIDPESGTSRSRRESRRTGADQPGPPGFAAAALSHRRSWSSGRRNARCECGSYDLALEGGILGRTDDMVVVRGVNVYPSAVEDILRAVGGVAEYRVEIRTDHALPELSIQVEPSVDHDDGTPAGPPAGSRIDQRFRLAHPGVRVPRGNLPRFEMKAQRWVRL